MTKLVMKKYKRLKNILKNKGRVTVRDYGIHMERKTKRKFGTMTLQNTLFN